MNTPDNPFKAALARGETQIGLWAGLGNAYCAEILAGAGFDWLLLDAEHAPNDLRSLLAQLQAVAPYRSHPIVRPRSGDAALIKQLLDIGAQTLLVPLVESAEQAAQLAAAMRYPPEGIRGVGAAIARASRWTRHHDYLEAANERACLLVQVETPAGIANLEAIARTPGVDGVFLGPADLSATMGYRGQLDHPQVRATMEAAVATILACGKAAGTLWTDEAGARHWLGLGCTFVAVGIDTLLLARAADALARRFRPEGP